MSYKQKLKSKDLSSDSKKKINDNHQLVRKKRYDIDPLDDKRGNGVMTGEGIQQGSGALVDLLFKVAPHLLAPLAEAVGQKIGKFIRGEGTRLAGNGTRLAGNGVRLAGNGVRLAGDFSPNKPRRIQAKKKA